MKKKLVFSFCLVNSMLAVHAQTRLSGEADVSAGLGQTSPWNVGAQLDIKKEGKFSISPYIRAYGINRMASETNEDADFTYTGKMPLSNHEGNRYTLQKKTDMDGWRLECGVHTQFTPNAHHMIKFDIESNNVFQTLNGQQTEQLCAADGMVISSLRSTIYNPSHNRSTQGLSALYRYKTGLEGEAITLQYRYTRNYTEEQHSLDVSHQEGFEPFKKSQQLFTDATTQLHDVQFDWHRTLAKAQSFDLGARYEDRLIECNDLQWLDNEKALDETFRHDYFTLGAFAAYSFHAKSVTATARLEYDYTRQQGHSLNDLVPTMRVQWQLDKANSFLLAYGRRIIRPTAEYLNPSHIQGTYTLDYGNEDLIGMHANNVLLTYSYRSKPLLFLTNLQHIFADDGFNLICMERDGIRISTWGNEGQRRAWGVTPSVEWTPSARTTLDASTTLLWDKRVAEAIHMAKEHWGITVHVGLRQHLPLAVLLRLSADYAEGNTLDLYSHAGRSWGASAGLQRDFGKHLTVALDYRYNEYAKIVYTQGAYTGFLNLRPSNHNMVVAKVTLNF